MQPTLCLLLILSVSVDSLYSWNEARRPAFLLTRSLLDKFSSRPPAPAPHLTSRILATRLFESSDDLADDSGSSKPKKTVAASKKKAAVKSTDEEKSKPSSSSSATKKKRATSTPLSPPPSTVPVPALDLNLDISPSVTVPSPDTNEEIAAVSLTAIEAEKETKTEKGIETGKEKEKEKEKETESSYESLSEAPSASQTVTVTESEIASAGPAPSSPWKEKEEEKEVEGFSERIRERESQGEFADWDNNNAHDDDSIYLEDEDESASSPLEREQRQLERQKALDKERYWAGWSEEAPYFDEALTDDPEDKDREDENTLSISFVKLNESNLLAPLSPVSPPPSSSASVSMAQQVKELQLTVRLLSDTLSRLEKSLPSLEDDTAAPSSASEAWSFSFLTEDEKRGATKSSALEAGEKLRLLDEINFLRTIVFGGVTYLAILYFFAIIDI